MRLLSIASGSDGNCIYVGNGNTHLLIDAGISKKRIEEGLATGDINPRDIDGILITHEHSDHINGLRVIAGKYHIPIYATRDTADYIKFKCAGFSAKYGTSRIIDGELFTEVSANVEFYIKDLKIKPFRIYHDALNPVGYRIEDGRESVAVATDMGHFDDYTVDNLMDLDAILIEANHDIRMVEVGSYPYMLKRRILGDRGHLCNESCGKLLDRILNDKLKRIILGHLSRENNFPELAYRSVKNEIDNGKSPYKSDDFRIEVARRGMPGTYSEF